VTLPPVARRELPNGMTLLVVEQHELPVADFVLVVGTGAEADPAGKAGAATLMADLLTEGTSTRSALEIADQSAFLGVQLDATSGWDVTSVSLHTPTAQLDSALALFADVVLRPTFPAAELERRRQERLTGLLQLKDRAPAIADRAFATTLYGASHPYGRALIGTEGSTRSITRADLQGLYRSYVRPGNATLVVVGDVRPDDVAARVQRLFGGWQGGAAAPPRLGTPPAVGATAVYLVDKPGAAQSSFRIGTVGVARSTEDYFPLLVMNTILGGSFTSRLNQNLRETRGYTYGAQSAFSMRRTAGPFQARAEVVTAKTDSALLEFMKELRAIRDTVPVAELAKAKQFLQLQLPGDFETTRDIAAQLVPLVVYGLPLDYYNGYVQSVERVTQADVQRVAERYLDPARLAVVIVGDRKTVEPGLRALGVGPVTVREVGAVIGR
jgi:predicted Zn-dependent peptidase